MPFSRDELIGFEKKPIIEQLRAVKFQDVDAAGTIFFPRVLEYMADVYQELLARAGIDVPRVLREKTLAIPLVHAEADFVTPLFFGDQATVQVLVARVGTKSVVFGHRIKKGDAVAAIGSTVHVFVDGATFRPTAVPDALRDYLSSAP
ncbi:MAG: acyl-CoA thioesterase [Polyangiaceae bacterium]|nr:acyl-CoA thioesterase [Polyangiaceae bacterium]